jgi:hypothetical protein
MAGIIKNVVIIGVSPPGDILASYPLHAISALQHLTNRQKGQRQYRRLNI